ncbi:MAG: hydrolase [Pseudonocardiales bacterium]|nr:hydrolase [Pseudonocardiales bacterium]
MPVLLRPARHSALRRAKALLAVPVFLCAALLAPSMAHAAPAPVNPTDQQIADAMANKAAAAGNVGALSAQLAQMQNQIDGLYADAQLKQELYNKAVIDLQASEDAAAAAQAAVAAAQAAVVAAQERFNQFARASYMAGSVGGTGGSLLTSTDPSSVLALADVRSYASANQLDAISGLNKATVEQSNADAVARDAVNQQTAMKAAADDAMHQATAALNGAVAQKQSLDGQMVLIQQQLAAAQIALTGLADQRAAYAKWQVEEAARIAAEEARKAAEAAAALAAVKSGSSNVSQQVAATPSGSWTPQLGQQAVAEAKGWIGQAYSWAGGNLNGPTYGVNSPGTDGYNDSKVYGFDCSGLMLYAWYQSAGLKMPHYAASQYGYGSVHPSNSSLVAGDLLFYSTNGKVAGIHHVAMYVGGGQMIEAPNSGATVRVTSVRLGGDYFGATRVLT